MSLTFFTAEVLYHLENLLWTKSCAHNRDLVVSSKGCLCCCCSWWAGVHSWGEGQPTPFQSALGMCGAIGPWAWSRLQWRGLLPLARRAHIVLWGQEGPWRLSPEVDPYLFVCCFQGLQSQEEEYRPHRKKKEQEIIQKGVMKWEKQQETARESREASVKGKKFWGPGGPEE